MSATDGIKASALRLKAQRFTAEPNASAAKQHFKNTALQEKHDCLQAEIYSFPSYRKQH